MKLAARHTHFPVWQHQFRVTIRRGRLQLPGEFLESGGHRNPPSEATQTMTQEILQAWERELAQSPHACRITLTNKLPVELCQFIKETGRFGEMARRLGKRSFRRGKTLAYCGQRLVAKKIASQRCIGITLVGYPGQTFGRCIAFDFSAGSIEQRAQQTQRAKTSFDRHPRRAGHAGPAQQVE